jgi:hypothetical protein
MTSLRDYRCSGAIVPGTHVPDSNMTSLCDSRLFIGIGLGFMGSVVAWRCYQTETNRLGLGAGRSTVAIFFFCGFGFLS